MKVSKSERLKEGETRDFPNAFLENCVCKEEKY